MWLFLILYLSWHPDRVTEEHKAAAEEKFKDINEAYSVGFVCFLPKTPFLASYTLERNVRDSEKKFLVLSSAYCFSKNLPSIFFFVCSKKVRKTVRLLTH